jgi:hypothetical protein
LGKIARIRSLDLPRLLFLTTEYVAEFYTSYSSRQGGELPNMLFDGRGPSPTSTFSGEMK